MSIKQGIYIQLNFIINKIITNINIKIYFVNFDLYDYFDCDTKFQFIAQTISETVRLFNLDLVFF